MDPFDIRQRNFYRRLDPSRPLISPGGMDISDIHKVVQHLLERADYVGRRQEVVAFNRGSRWIKRGLALVVHRYPVFSAPLQQCFDTFLRIGRDASVMITTGSV